MEFCKEELDADALFLISTNLIKKIILNCSFNILGPFSASVHILNGMSHSVLTDGGEDIDLHGGGHQ